MKSIVFWYFPLRWYLIEIVCLLLETSLYVCLQKFNMYLSFHFNTIWKLWSQLKHLTHHIPSFLNTQNSKAFVDEKNRFSYIVTDFFKFYLLKDVYWSASCCRFYDRTCTLRNILAQIEIFLAWHLFYFETKHKRYKYIVCSQHPYIDI